MIINTQLEIVLEGGKEVVRCKCGRVLCSGNENYKLFALRQEGPFSMAGPEKIFSGKYKGEERFVFRLFFCPGCLTVLECEVAPKGSQILRDYEPIPSPESQKIESTAKDRSPSPQVKSSG
ncbi:MAG TPA: acetone carboxylase subunit gamma [Nitrososphaerales archaeon]|nr:acetone carboxylase subunit gamma [Nitrososphaerales archaeon]